jgi:hypothetical protein
MCGFDGLGCKGGFRDLRELLRTAWWAFAMRLERESGIGGCGWGGGAMRRGGVGLEESYYYSGKSISLSRRVIAKFFCDKN